MGRKDHQRPAHVFVGAFGKHPGWDDHIDDLGLESDALILIKRLLYTQGINANIDGGKWDALEENRRLDRFAHVFLWRQGDDLVFGRLWSSSDGKGRTRYPMVVAAHVRGLALDWAAAEILPRLEHLEQQCTGTTSASAVRSAVDASRESMRIAVTGAGTRAFDTGAAHNPVQLLREHPSMGARDEGLLRVLYQIEREMSAFRRVPPVGSTTMRMKGVPPRPQHIRVPRCFDSLDKSLAAWMSLLITQLHDAAPVLMLLPLEQSWIDVIVGEPSEDQFFCMRAGAEVVPLVTDVPFTFEPDFEYRAREFIKQAAASNGVRFATNGVSHLSQTEGGLFRKLAAVFRSFIMVLM